MRRISNIADPHDRMTKMMRAVLKRSLVDASKRPAVSTGRACPGHIICYAHLPIAQSVAVRSFASSTGKAESSAGYEMLKKDFRRWVGKEVRILFAMIVVGVAGVKIYQNREDAPARQVATLLDKARENAQKVDREAALQNCLQAYSIVKSTNAQDRHLFELAFLVAAQFETLGKTSQATRFYLDALSSVPYVRDADERNLGRVVVLDRIAQCYQDQGEQRAAENYYRQAVETYDKTRGGRSPADQQIDREIAVVLFNYGQQLVQLKRWDDAKVVLHRAQSLAKAASLPEEDKDRIDRLLLLSQLPQQTEEASDETEVV